MKKRKKRKKKAKKSSIVTYVEHYDYFEDPTSGKIIYYDRELGSVCLYNESF